MTSTAIRQFIALCGGDLIAKGSCVCEPQRAYNSGAYVIGRIDYIAQMIRPGSWGGLAISINCPFELGTPAAASWAAGKLAERRDERSIVEAYAQAKEHRS